MSFLTVLLKKTSPIRVFCLQGFFGWLVGVFSLPTGELIEINYLQWLWASNSSKLAIVHKSSLGSIVFSAVSIPFSCLYTELASGRKVQAAVINVCFTLLLASSAGFFSSGGRGSICSCLRDISPPGSVSLGRKICTLMYLICWLDSLITLGVLVLLGFFVCLFSPVFYNSGFAIRI